MPKASSPNNASVKSFKSQITASLGWNWNDGAVDSGRLDFLKLLQDSGGSPTTAVWSAKLQTLAEACTTTLDLTALRKTILGGSHTVSFAAISAVLLVNHGGGRLTVGGAAANEWWSPFGSAGDQAVIPAESPWLVADCQSGWPVDATHGNLKLTASGGEVTYSIVLVGRLYA